MAQKEDSQSVGEVLLPPMCIFVADSSEKLLSKAAREEGPEYGSRCSR